MKEKIMSALKTKFTGVQGEVLAWVADYLATSITSEDAIQGAVDGAESLVKMQAAFIQKETDRRVTEATKTVTDRLKAEHAAELEKLKNPTPPTPPAPPDPGTPPAWAKDLIDANKALAEKVTAFETEKVQRQHTDAVITHMRSKEIPESFYKVALAGRSFKDTKEVEDFASTIETSWTQHSQELADKGMGQSHKPLYGNPSKDGVSAAVADFLKTDGAPEGVGMGARSLNIDQSNK